jgi:tetratricopeptide (TPR) repeat protein
MASSTLSGLGWILTWHLLITSVLPSYARADAVAVNDDRAAREAFEAGRAAYEQGRFGEALRDYERSYVLSRRPELLYNIGRAAEAEADWSRAEAAYEQYLAALPGAENYAFAKARLERVKHMVPAKPTPVPDAPELLPGVTLAAPASAEAPLAQAVRPSENDATSTPAFWKRGWFWGAAAAVVAGSVVGIVIATRDSSPSRADTDLSVTQALDQR